MLDLLAITTLSVFKPWGLTRYGLRKRRERLSGNPLTAVSAVPSSDREATVGPLSGLKVLGIATVVVIVLFDVLQHLASGGLLRHGH